MRRIAMPDQFKLSFKRGLELGPANNLREQLVSDHRHQHNLTRHDHIHDVFGCDDGHGFAHHCHFARHH